jgi:hypothetical protein
MQTDFARDRQISSHSGTYVVPFLSVHSVGHGSMPKLEHFLNILNRGEFPKAWISDSRCGLVKEASPHDESSFD